MTLGDFNVQVGFWCLLFLEHSDHRHMLVTIVCLDEDNGMVILKGTFDL